MSDRDKVYKFSKFGHEYWYKNNELHREDGPACTRSDGSKYWFLNGKRHRLDGPAIINSDGKKEWWINGKLLTKEEWWERISDEMKVKALFNGEGL